MTMLRAMRERWHEWNAAERREEDERDRLVRLLAFRDAFIATLVLMVGLLVLQIFLTGEARRGTLIPAILALVPLVVISVAGVVWLISWRLRGGGGGQRVALFRAAKVVAGLVAGYTLVAVLSWSGAIALEIELWPFLAGSALGLLIVVLLLWLAIGRGDHARLD